MSFNAFKTVMDIDTLGTFNMSRVLYEKFFRVCVLAAEASLLLTTRSCPVPYPVCCRTMEG